jgi:predicted DNA-binding transcriptional regulator YafY
MKLPSIYDLVALIPSKQDGEITAHKLSTLTKVNEPTIRKIINEARTAGVPICSTRRGYYMSNEYDDIAKTICFLTNRVCTQLQAKSGLQKRLQEVEL